LILLPVITMFNCLLIKNKNVHGVNESILRFFERLLAMDTLSVPEPQTIKPFEFTIIGIQ